METKKLYSGGAMIAPETNYESVKNGNINLKEELEGGVSGHDAAIEKFDVEVDYESIIKYNQLTEAVATDEQPTYDQYKHLDCYFVAPPGEGKQKLLILFPGGGETGKSGYDLNGCGQVFTKIGYAVLAITGYSREFMVGKGVNAGRAVPVGSWYATRTAIKAYEYIKNKYDFIDTDGIFIYGESQGGMIAENFADFSGANIRATVLDAPAVSMLNVQYFLRSDNISAIYGGNDMTSNASTFDSKKCLGCDPWTRGIIPYVGSDGNGGIEYQSAMPNDANTPVKVGKIRNCNSPVLITTTVDDNLVRTWVVKDYAEALMNAGQWVEYICYADYDGAATHGTIDSQPKVGTIGGYEVGVGFIDILNFLKRQGGYDFEVVPLSNDNAEE